MRFLIHIAQLSLVLTAVFSSCTDAADWNPRTVDWNGNAKPKPGDWGFDRPGFPRGLYLHGVSQRAGAPIENPVIYDNDVYDDVFDDEWVMARASVGRLNLVGLIVTPVLTDGWGFSKPDWIKTATEARDRAIKSGMRMDRIPPITIGTEAESEKAGEKKSSAGARLYVKLINQQFEKDPTQPLIVNIGGQGATLASAWCIDPSIADKCVVYYTDLRVYNGHYQWASELVAKNFRVISWGEDNWWINKRCQNEWNVLPRPVHCQAKDNDANSGEWARLTSMHVPMLDAMVHSFQHRHEYCQEGAKGDGYLDGTLIHAWLPGLFADAQLKDNRGGRVLHITKFTAENEALVKEFTLRDLLDPRAYGRKPTIDE